MANSRQIPAIYFTALELENVRCFGETQRFDLTDLDGNPAQWTLLLGDNGLGKTTILQCLSWMRPVFLPTRTQEGQVGTDDDSDAPPPLRKGQLGPALPGEQNEVLEGLLRSGKNVELILSAELSYNKPLSSHSGVKKAKEIPKFKKITTGIKLSYTKKRELQDSKLQGNTRIETLGRFLEPLIVAYGANRQIGQQNLNKSDLDDPIASRLSGVTELYDAEEILNKLDHAAAKKGNKGLEKDRLERVKKILAVVLPHIEKAEDIRILAPRIVADSNKPQGVRVKTFSGLVPLSALSLGYQTTLAWTVDLAWRLFRRYNSSRDPLAEPAIVLIDEIDLHLHPLWQRTIMDSLSLLFPKTQFIATAHSPLMVQAAPTANFAVVQKEKDEVRIENCPEVVGTWRVDQILTSEFFDVPNSRHPDIERLFRDRAELLNRIRRGPAEEARLKQLESQLAEIPTAEDPEDRKAMDIIRKAAALLK